MESAWGEAAIGGYNLFGRKAVDGDSCVVVETDEYVDNNWITINAAFKAYSNLDEAIEDYCILITEEPVYAPVLECRNNLEEYVRTLGSIYATDPDYADKILSTIAASDLTQWDV